MNTLLLGFIGPQEIIVVLFILLPGVLFFVFVVLLIRYLNRKQKSQKTVVDFNDRKPEEKDFHEFENRKDYYPVKEGNKITLIPFSEIVDLSTQNNFVFLTDNCGKEYLVESTLTELKEKFPDNFIRVHKSAIVNKSLIREVKKMGNGRFDLFMKCEKERIISCSKSYNEKIKSIIDF